MFISLFACLSILILAMFLSIYLSVLKKVAAGARCSLGALTFFILYNVPGCPGLSPAPARFCFCGRWRIGLLGWDPEWRWRSIDTAAEAHGAHWGWVPAGGDTLGVPPRMDDMLDRACAMWVEEVESLGWPIPNWNKTGIGSQTSEATGSHEKGLEDLSIYLSIYLPIYVSIYLSI